ncbi:hypothetical protein GF327_03650 [Candidatus Woesearchaeota archaeon]|nr:hypothetical protein [Candidatus Woesearchaeota archaeon]
MEKKIKHRDFQAILLVLFLLIIYFSIVIAAEPEGGTIDFKSNSTKNITPPSSRNDTKGTITTIVMTATQQNTKWKAYVGNVTGTLVLRDAADYSIYEWTSIGDPTGEVYITRNDSIEWSNIKCANSTIIDSEQVFLNHSPTSRDNINNTFSNQAHDSFWVGDVTEIQNSTCWGTATWINDSSQTINEDSLFQEILLYDNTNLIYTTIIEQNLQGYRNDSATTYDFQAILPDNALPGSTGQVTYYFYVEIESG